jgi:hypothetical protein
MLNSYLSGATDSSNLGFSILKNGSSVSASEDHGAYFEGSVRMPIYV